MPQRFVHGSPRRVARAIARALAVLALLVPASLGLVVLPAAAEGAHAIPAPALDEPAAQGAAPEIVVLAGGCFWGVQGVFQHVKGVTSAVSGYAGGAKGTAQYEIVSTGTTGHAESVQVTFDPRQISFGHILQIYFSAAHDPTELNYQGPDEGDAISLDDLPDERGAGARSPKPISRSSRRRMRSPRRSSPPSSPIIVSTRPRRIIRIS